MATSMRSTSDTSSSSDHSGSRIEDSISDNTATMTPGDKTVGTDPTASVKVPTGDLLLEQEEAAVNTTELRIDTVVDRVRQQEGERARTAGAATRAAHEAVAVRRAGIRRADNDLEDMRISAEQTKRVSLLSAMSTTDGLSSVDEALMSSPHLLLSAEGQLRSREDSVVKRHSELQDLRQRALTMQRDLSAADERRQTAALAQHAKFAEAQLQDQIERTRTEVREAARVEFDEILGRRELEAKVRRDDEKMRLETQLRMFGWHKKTEEARRHARQVAEKVKIAQDMKAEAEIQLAEHERYTSYESLKQLHQSFIDQTQRLENEIAELNGAGSYLNLLMQAAKDTAESEGRTFYALKAIALDTMIPSTYTPDCLPQPRVRTKDSGAQTVLSEMSSSTATTSQSKKQGLRRSKW